MLPPISKAGASMKDELSAFALRVIAGLRLVPHPEGGWYRRTWASAHAAGGGELDQAYAGENSTGDVRPLASLICFLLPKGDASAWHRVDADEIWLWHGPASIVLELGGIGDKPDEGMPSGMSWESAKAAARPSLSFLPAPGKGNSLQRMMCFSPVSSRLALSMQGFSLRGSLLRHRCRSCQARSWQPDAPLSPCVLLHR